MLRPSHMRQAEGWLQIHVSAADHETASFDDPWHELCYGLLLAAARASAAMGNLSAASMLCVTHLGGGAAAAAQAHGGAGLQCLWRPRRVCSGTRAPRQPLMPAFRWRCTRISGSLFCEAGPQWSLG
eukprot:TRINITY_DN4420_c0_g1_i1.p3 TRINITY_DN4420_c0_g1~~TRINITY_DN4420_c0_g1_i1.p3  ORF type:complete len:127 (-),score=24.69 TRINITY_DN4420_c0_g1_i1:295-675(-)